MNLAEQLKNELTERAKSSDSCKKYLLDYVIDCFRGGENPVEIKCMGTANHNEVSEQLQKKFNFDYKGKLEFFHFRYENGHHYAMFRGRELDITDLPDAQRFAVDGRDESDKILFLQSEGFYACKRWELGKGYIIKVFYLR